MTKQKCVYSYLYRCYEKRVNCSYDGSFRRLQFLRLNRVRILRILAWQVVTVSRSRFHFFIDS